MEGRRAQTASGARRGRTVLAASLLASLPCASAFVLPEFPPPRWSLPLDPLSTDGLGRSIAYAVDPQLCAQLRPLMLEKVQGWIDVPCLNLHTTIARAFASWAANHKHISFYNVTTQCLAEQAAPGNCSSAEVYITARPPRTIAEASVPAATELAVTYNDPPVPTMAGAAPRAGEPRITRATIALFSSPSACWFLDLNLCSYILSLGYDFELFIVLMYFICMIVGIAMILWETYYHAAILVSSGSLTLHKGWPFVTARNLPAWFDRAMDICDDTLKINLLLFLLVFPNVFYNSFVHQCFTCQPFEPTLLHEIGISLGLGSTAPTAQSYAYGYLPAAGAAAGAAAARLSAANCASAYLPLSAAAALFNVSAPPARCDYAKWWACGTLGDSLMAPPKPHHTSACLGQDDLDGLNALYPSCAPSRVTEPLCVPTSRNAAWLRLMLMFGVPLLIMAVLLPLCNCVGFQMQKRTPWLRLEPEAKENRSATRRLDRIGGEKGVAKRAKRVEASGVQLVHRVSAPAAASSST